MAENNINQEIRLKKIGEIKNYFIKEIDQNELMSKKHKNVCAVLNDKEHLLILASAITGCVSISTFASVVGISIRVTSPPKGIK